MKTYDVFLIRYTDDPYKPHPWAVANLKRVCAVHAKDPQDAVKFAKRLGVVLPVVSPVQEDLQ